MQSTPSLCRRAVAVVFALSAAVAGPALATGEILLIPNSGTDKIWAVSPVDGSIISQTFIPNTELKMTQPIQAIPSGTGTILVTDEVRKSVFEYSSTGVYLRTLAEPATGAAGAYSLCVKNGFVYFTSGSGVSTSSGYVYRVPLTGGPVTVFSDWSTLGAPRGIHPYGDGFLVGNSTASTIEILDASGNVSPTPFWRSEAGIGIRFPQQIQRLEKGQILGASWMVCGFSAPAGIYLYDAVGIPQGYFEPATSPRGCHMLANGDILFTGGTQIRKIDMTTGGSVVLFNGNSAHSFRFINLYTPPVPCPADIDGNGVVNGSDLAAVLAAWGSTGSPADVNGSGTVDASDLAVVLAAWGSC